MPRRRHDGRPPSRRGSGLAVSMHLRRSGSPASSATPSTRYQPVNEQVLDDQGEHAPGRPRPASPALGQQRARDQQPRDERQPDPLDLGLAHPGERRRPAPSGTAAPTSQRTDAGRRRRSDVAGAADRAPRSRRRASGPALKARAARLPHHQYVGGRLLRDPCPVAVVQRRQRLPPVEAVGAVKARTTTRAADAPPTGAAARCARPRARRPRAARAAAARRTASRRSRAAARRPATTAMLRRTAADGQGGDAPRGDRGEHRVGADALPDRRRPEDQERRGPAGDDLGAEQRAASPAPRARSRPRSG